MIINQYTKGQIDNIYRSIRESMRRFILLQGGTGVGKTLYAKALACLLTTDVKWKMETTEEINEQYQKLKQGTNEDKKIDMVCFNKGTTYENFIYGSTIETQNGCLKYNNVKQIFLTMASKAEANKKSKYVLILDDINRADFSRVMGDVLSALEGSDVGNLVRAGVTQYSIPDNLYLIATHNPVIGNSVIDYAWLRRFLVYDVFSDERHIIASTDIIVKNNRLNSKEEKDDPNYVSCYEGAKEQDRIMDYIYSIYMHVKIIHDRYFTDTDTFVKKQYMLGHGMFLTYDGTLSFRDNVRKFTFKLNHCIIPILYQYISDGLLSTEASFDVEVLEHMWDKNWGVINHEKFVETRGTVKKEAMETIRKIIGKVPNAVFYLFFLHNPYLMRKCYNGEMCFLFEEDCQKYRPKANEKNGFHVSSQYITINGKRLYSINLGSRDSFVEECYGCGDGGNGEIFLPYIIFEYIKKFIRLKELENAFNGNDNYSLCSKYVQQLYCYGKLKQQLNTEEKIACIKVLSGILDRIIENESVLKVGIQKDHVNSLNNSKT